MIQEAVPESQVFPDVDFLAKKAIVLKTGLVFDQLRVEQALGNLHMALVLDHQIQASESLRHILALPLSHFAEPRVWDAWDQPYEGVFRADNLLD